MSSHHKGREAIYSIINKICISNIETLHVPRYREELYNIKKYNKKNNLAMPYKKIPVLLFKANGQGSKYRIYCDFLVAIIKALQKRFLHHFASDKAGLPDMMCPLETCVLVHLIEIREHGQYTSFSAMELYDIIHSMNVAGLLSRNSHVNCCCGDAVDQLLDHRASGYVDEDRVLQLRQSVSNHYAVVTNIRAMFASYENTFEIKTDETIENIEYEIEVKLHLGDHDEFSLFCPSVPMIAFGKETVVIFMITQSFSILTCDEIFVQALMCMKNRQEKWHGQRICACVFTFSSKTPIWIDFELLIGDDFRVLKDCVTAAFVKKLSHTNSELLRLWKKCLDAELHASTNSDHALIEGALMAVKHELTSMKNSNKNVPSYADTYFSEALKSVRRKRPVIIDDESIRKDLEDNLRIWLDDIFT